ncbi:MAG: hypothetical protein IJD88_00095, partial [Clostridia bacterium]|nr:hypothetical protein [Clostridia bacterium]
AYIDGELAEPDTDPDDANTYLIYRAEELAWVSYYVSLKNTLSGKTVKLMKDINLERTYVDENGETKRYNWTPIGARSADGTVSADYYFRGTFDGQHKKIYGLYIETDKVATGLFGYILGTSGAYVNIKNFGVVNPEIKATLAATTNDGIGVISGDVGYVNFEHIFVRGGSVESTYRASGFVGAVASSKGNIKMTNCYVQGTTVRATGTADATATAGGLISTNRTDATIITNCYSSAKLTSDYSQNNVGGIVAHANNTITITNSYSEGYALYGESPKVPTANGGSEQVEAGELKSYATVLGAEYTYDANEAINNGYPIFVCEETESLLTDAYYYEVYSERSDYAEDISKACPTEWEAYMNEMNAVKALINDDKNSSEEEMNTAIAALNTARDALKTAYYKAESVVIPWNGTTILEGTEMVPAIVDGAWEIYRAEELAYFASYVNGGQKMSGVTVKLMKDIDLDDINWTPIGGNGSTSIYFSGIFDGQHHKVYGLNIVSKTYAVGLFGFVFGASATNKAYIRNLGIIEPTVSSTYATTTSGNYGVAALAGAIEWAEVEHCFVRDGSVTAAFRAAGLVGSTITKTEANAQVIRNCYVQGTTVTSTGTNTSRSSAGALVAYNNAGITAIENCYVANVTISSELGETYMGALMGYTGGDNAVTISNSYAEGYALYGTAEKTPVVADMFTRQVETGLIKGFVENLGEEYTYPLSDTDNDGYPVFWCEDPEATLRRVYLIEASSERTTYAEMIKNAVDADLWSAYENAMAEAKTIVEDDKISSEEELSAKAEALITAKEALYEAYNTSKAVVIPWNGDIMMPELVDGVYLIYRAEELAMVSEYVSAGYPLGEYTFKIMKNLDLNGENYEWKPIGGRYRTGDTMTVNNYFAGTVDGQGNIITNMNIDAEAGAAGLFGLVIGGTIRNIGVEDSTVTFASASESNNAGAILVANAQGMTLDACYVRNCEVNGTNGPVAAVVGYVYTTASTISNCYAQNVELNVTSSQKTAAGILGLNIIAGTTITNCYANVTATSSLGSDYEGGIVGNVGAAITITNSYCANNETLYASMSATAPTIVSGSATVDAEALKGYANTLGTSFGDDFNGEASINAGYPILYWEDPEFELRKLYAFEITTPRNLNPELMTKYTTEYAEYLAALEIAEENANDNVVLSQADAQVIYNNLKNAASDLHYAYSRDMDALVPWDTSTVEPESVVEDGMTVYKIYSAEELAWVADRVNNYGETFADCEINLEKDIQLGDKEWTSIGHLGVEALGTESASFAGRFDGKHHKIYGLKITKARTVQGYALFGSVSGGVIKNFGVIEPEINVSGNYQANYGVAAVIGRIAGDGLSLKHVFVRNPQISGDYIVGGLVGMSYKATSVSITNCYVQGGTVTSANTATSAAGSTAITEAAGGIIGGISTNSSTASTVNINNTYSTATLTENNSAADYTGAVIGRAVNNNGKQKVNFTWSFGITDNGEDDLYGTSTLTPTTSNSKLVTADALKANARAISTEYYEDYLGTVNAGFPIFWCENIFKELDDKLNEAKDIDETTLDYYSAIHKLNPELIENLENAISDAESYLDNNPDVSQMQTYIAAIDTAIAALNAKNDEYVNDSSMIAGFAITVLAPPILTLDSTGNYAADQIIKIKSNYLLTSHTLTGDNGITLEYVPNSLVVDGVGEEATYTYAYKVTGGTPDAPAEGQERNTTVVFTATAEANGQIADATANSAYLIKTGSATHIDTDGTHNKYKKNLWDETGHSGLWLETKITGYHAPAESSNSSREEYDDDTKDFNRGTKSSGFVGSYYVDLNTKNIYNVANEPISFTVRKYGRADEDESNVSLYSEPKGWINSTESHTDMHIANKSFTCYSVVPSGALQSKGEVQAVTYNRYGYMRDGDGDSNPYTTNTVTFVINFTAVDTTALWNLYNSEANKIGRFDYKDLY